MTGDIRTSFAAEWRGFLATATPDQIEDFIASLAPGEAARLVHAWCLWARPSQLPPQGDWRVWLLMAGRGFAGMAEPRRQALISMAFNLGGPRLAGFRRMRAAIAGNDWNRAADEALDSRWARQTGRRANETAALFRGG